MKTTTDQSEESGGQAVAVTPLAAPTWILDLQPWPEPVSGDVLLADLEQLLRRFAILPKWAPETLALWTLHTYAFHLREVSAYLGLESPEKRCGKTTVLSVLCELVNRPVVAANISSPAFFRVIAEVRPTLLIDETDTFLPGNDELRGILNSGYTRKTAFVVRVASQDSDPKASRLVRFSCWCPKVMAAIGRLPDTLADRCIVIRMQRKTAAETCERLRILDATALRRRCLRFVQDNAAAIAAACPQLPPDLNDRAGDIWEPLLALADLAGGPWPERARQAAVALTAVAQETNPIAALLLEILHIFVRLKTNRLFSRTIVLHLNIGGDRSWTELRKGRAVDEIWLARQLRPYGVQPRTFWINKAQAKGYLQEDFSDAFSRYIPKSDLQALRAACQPNPPPQPSPA